MARLKVLSKQETSYSSDWLDYMDLPFVQFVIKNSRQIGYGALVLLLVIILGYRFLAYRSNLAEKDFISAKEAALGLNDPEKSEKSLATLQSILSTHPSLQAKYDGLVGQTLLTQGKLEEAKPYIERTLTRTKSEASPSDLEYAKTSLLIAEGKYDEALKNAYLLKESAISPTLYAFNLIRIAFLERTLTNPVAEQQAWNELKGMESKMPAHEYNKVMTHFDDQGASLKDYIK